MPVNLKATKEQFEKYRNIQRCGRYNMLTECNAVIKSIGCTEDQYFDMVWHYNTYLRQYGI